MTTSRSELLRVIGELSDEASDLRLGQLITNLATLARGANVEAVWDAEDEEFIAAAKRLLTRYQDRKQTIV